MKIVVAGTSGGVISMLLIGKNNLGLTSRLVPALLYLIG